MRYKRNIAFVLTFVMLLSFASPMGCGGSGSHEKRPTLLGDEEPFYGSLLQKIISGLFEGA